MQEPNVVNQLEACRTPWNRGKMIGAKPPLRTKNVWSIRTNLQVAGRIRDLAMFNLAIDSKLRGCDVVSLRVEDVAPQGSRGLQEPHFAGQRHVHRNGAIVIKERKSATRAAKHPCCAFLGSGSRIGQS